MMMWNDQIGSGEPVNLPRDILLQFWREAAPDRGPEKSCTIDQLIGSGFSVINSYYPETYIDEETYMTAESIARWSPFLNPVLPDTNKDAILGGETCAWEYGNYAGYPFYTYTLPSSMALFADRLWNADDYIPGDDYGVLLTRALLGPATPEGFNVFAGLGGFIPPRDKEKRAYVESVTCSAGQLRAMLGCLTMLTRQNNPYASTAKAYAECIEWVIKQM